MNLHELIWKSVCVAEQSTNAADEVRVIRV